MKTKQSTQKNNYLRDLILSWVIVFSIGLFLGCLITSLIFVFSKDEEVPEAVSEEIIEEEIFTIEEVLPIPIIADMPEEPIEEEKEYLGEYRITAYCSCKKCCGQWADNRPNGIVYGAMGVELEAGVSVASPLPFGTTVYIDGLGEYVVQDRLANWVVDKYGDNLIDVYFDNHEEACNFGLKYLDVYMA